MHNYFEGSGGYSQTQIQVLKNSLVDMSVEDQYVSVQLYYHAWPGLLVFWLDVLGWRGEMPPCLA